MKLWTVWCEYGATGEGQTLLAWIGYAQDKKSAKAIFAERFGTFFTEYCEAEQGVSCNDVTLHIFSKKTLDSLARLEGYSNIDAASCIHTNSS